MPSQLRPSISLLNIFLLIAICGLSLAQYVTHRDRAKLGTRLVWLEGSMEAILVDDPSLIYLRRLRQPAPLAWRFQIALPKDGVFRLYFGEGVVAPHEEHPPAICSFDNAGQAAQSTDPAQGAVSIFARRLNSRCVVGYGMDGRGKGTATVSAETLGWIESNINSWGLGGPPQGSQHDVQVFQATDSVTLLRLSENDGYSPFWDGPKKTLPLTNPRVFEVWLEKIDDQSDNER